MLNRALESLNAGRVRDAAGLAQQLLAQKPTDPNALFLWGLVTRAMGQFSDSLNAFLQVTRQDSENPNAWAHVAESFVTLGEVEKADQALREAIQREDGTPELQHSIANTFAGIGNFEEARAWFKKARRQQPRNVDLLVNLAITEMFLGELDSSRAHLQQVLSYRSDHAQAHWLLAGMSTAENFSHVETMREELSSHSLSPQDTAHLEYACGKELEDLEKWEEAFSAYSRGAEAVRSTIHFDEKAEDALFDALIETYTEEWLADGQGFDDDSAIFIVGQPRSGTTLVERILSAHSGIQSAGELKHFPGIASQLINSGEQPTMRQLREIDARRLGETYVQSCDRYRRSAGKLIDKYPPNFIHIPLILKSLPNARVIHLQRNPMDTCFAVFKQLFAGAYPHSYTLEEMARHYVRYRRLLDVWEKRFGRLFLSVRYEDVVENTERETRRLLQFLNLPWEQECLQFHRQKAPSASASTVQVRNPIHARSIGRWKKYAEQLEPVQRILASAGIAWDTTG